MEKKFGTASIIGRQIAYNQASKTWSAYPDYYINNPGMYRKDLWDEIGMTPATWDDVRIGGAKLKAKGHPVGCSLARSNDPNLCWRGVLWSYGASVQDKSGEHVVLDSKAAVEAVKSVTALYKEAMTSEVLPGMTPATTSISIRASARSSSTRSLPIGRRNSSTKKLPKASLS